MRIDEFLNQNISTKNLSRYKTQRTEAATFSLNQDAQDKVSISTEAKEAQQTGGYFTKSEAAVSEAKMQFQAYMDAAMGRVPQAPKSPEEKIKELTAKIKKLQTQLSEVISDNSLPEEARGTQAENITSQINALHAQIAEIGKQMSAEATASEE